MKGNHLSSVTRSACALSPGGSCCFWRILTASATQCPVALAGRQHPKQTLIPGREGIAGSQPEGHLRRKRPKSSLPGPATLRRGPSSRHHPQPRFTSLPLSFCFFPERHRVGAARPVALADEPLPLTSIYLSSSCAFSRLFAAFSPTAVVDTTNRSQGHSPSEHRAQGSDDRHFPRKH